jgi:lipid-binding SYLF domain-containing protein
LASEIRKATYSLLNFTQDNAFEGKDRIPEIILSKAKGIAFLTVVKAGFMLTGRMGTGLVICKLEDGTWSPPSAIGIYGVGYALN